MDGEITVEELQSLLDLGGDQADETDGDGGTDGDHLRIVDIRNPDAFAHGHIPGSENVPAPELTDRVEELDGAERVVTVCPHGKASVQAARLVASYEGVDGPVESLRDGITAWGGPLERSADGDGHDESGAEKDAGRDAGSRTDDSTAPF